MRRPLILTTCDSNDSGYFLRYAYVRAIENAGGHMTIALPNSEDSIATLMSEVDGLFLTGGDDIHPKHYGETFEPHYNGKVDEPRYDLENKLIGVALERNMPILGICHGMQMINVYFGGSLHQDITHEVPSPLTHDNRGNFDRSYLAHNVTLEEDSTLARIMEKASIMTNSMHHQGIDRLAIPLTAVGKTRDELLEAFEMKDYPYLIGVQWHPEELFDSASKLLFSSFIEACITYRNAQKNGKIVK